MSGIRIDSAFFHYTPYPRRCRDSAFFPWWAAGGIFCLPAPEDSCPHRSWMLTPSWKSLSWRPWKQFLFVAPELYWFPLCALSFPM